MPFASPEDRRNYMTEYEQERRLGLRRTGDAGEVAAAMDERRAERERYLREWEAANRERRSRARRENRRREKLEQQLAAVRRVTTT